MPVSNNLRAGNILIQNMKSEYIKAYEKFEKLDEGASEGVKINSFQELENFLKINKEGLPYSKVEITSSNSSLNVQIKLISNKKVSIDESLDSWISLDYDISTEDNYIRGWAASGKKDTSSLFAGVKKNENATFSSMYEIVNMCNPVDMYNSCVKKTTTEISYISPIIVSTFDLCVKKILRGNHTLSVHYDAVLGKFVYTYNPDFVLLSSIDEFVLNGSKYNSFQDCYCYVLSFLICHEMMHLIHHNVTSGIEDEGNTSHFTDNLIYDSFINCKLSRLLKRNSFSRDNYYGSPVLNGGVNDEFVLRSEHNKGLKSYSTAYDIQNAIAEFLKKTLNISQDYSEFSGKNINTLGFAGADFILKIKINKDSDEMRASSGILKKITQGICKLLSEGNMFAAQEGLSLQEVESDLDVLPAGTLVRMRASGEICVISGYESSSGVYSLNKTVISAVDKVTNEDGGIVCTPTYSDSGESKGKFRRIKFEEFSPESWTEYDKEQVYQQSLSDEDLQTPEDTGLGGGMQMPETSKEKEKVFHIGDIVWVRRKKSFGRISKMENGMFTLEEVEEVGVKKLDDSDFHVNESVSGDRVVLKERVFAPTGKVLGEFTVSDLETFDKVYKDSNKSGGESGSSDLSTVPPPKDDDPLEKNGSGEDSSSKNSDKESEDSEGGSRDGSQESDSSSSSETSEEEDSSGSSTSSSDSSVGSDNKGSGDESEGSDSSNSKSGNSDSEGSADSDLEDSELDSSGNSDSSNPYGDGSSEEGSQSSNHSDLGSHEGSEGNASSKQSAGNSSGGMSGGEEPYEDEEDLDGEYSLSDSSGYSESAISEAIKQMLESSSESSNVKKEEEMKSGKEESSSSNDLETSRNSANEERSAMKDMLDAATEEAKKIRLNSPNSNKQSEADGDLENEILSSIGGSSLTKNISFKGVKDWKKKLERLLDSALGFDIQTDPNKINKKVADAPPGVEEMYPEIKNIAVLLDCSGSMGVGEFVKVVNHLNNLCAARKMNKTYFHLICWGTDDKKEVSKWYWKVKGSKAFFKCIKSNGAEKSWNTNLNPAIELITTKGKKFDAIIIMTDGVIFDTPSDDTKRFFKKYKERVIWALTDMGGIRYVKGFDPTCMSKERVVVFKK